MTKPQNIRLGQNGCSLIAGVRLDVNELCNINPHERLTINSGTECISVDEDTRYLNEAIAPRQDWRPLTSHELTKLTSPAGAHDLYSVRVIRMFDTEHLTYIQKIIKSLWLIPRASNRVWDHPAIRLAMTQLGSAGIEISELEYTGVTYDPPGLKTLSRDPVREKLVGLHIDYWDCNDLANRRNAKTRMSINIGTEPRKFLFCNLDCLHMYNTLKENREQDLPVEPTGIMRRFYKIFPEYPIVCTKIYPGEAYIASVDSISHDASSLGASSRVLQLSMRGHFVFSD